MKKVLLLIFAIALTGTAVQAQCDAKIETGMVAFNQGNFEDAIKAFDAGLSDPACLKPKNLPKGYFHRAMARNNVNMALMGKMGQKAQAKDTVGLEKMGRDMLTNLKNIINDFSKARETDAEAKFTAQIDQGIARVRGMVTMMVDQTLAELDKKVASKEIKPEDMKELKDLFLPILDAMIKADPDNYLNYDLRAQVYEGIGDTTNAITDYETSISKFRTKPPVEADMIFGYTYYRVANLYLGKKNMDKALTLLNDGKGVVDTEFKRMESKRNLYHDTIWVKFQNRHDKIYNALQTGELNVYLNSPEKANEAVAKFEKACAADPRNYNLHVALASLLETQDSAKAILYYNKAISIDPKKSLAYYNCGVYYNKKAAEFNKMGQDATDDRISAAYRTLRDDNFRLAKPMFEGAFANDPKSLPTVTALEQIATFLMNEEDIVKYGKLRRELRGTAGSQE